MLSRADFKDFWRFDTILPITTINQFCFFNSLAKWKRSRSSRQMFLVTRTLALFFTVCREEAWLYVFATKLHTGKNDKTKQSSIKLRLKNVLINYRYFRTYGTVKILTNYKTDLKHAVTMSPHHGYCLTCILSYIKYFSQKVRGSWNVRA